MAQPENNTDLGIQLTQAYLDSAHCRLAIELRKRRRSLAAVLANRPDQNSMISSLLCMRPEEGISDADLNVLMMQADTRKLNLRSALIGKIVTARRVDGAPLIHTYKTDIAGMILPNEAVPVSDHGHMLPSVRGNVSGFSGITYDTHNHTDNLLLIGSGDIGIAVVPIVGPDGSQLATIIT